MLKLERIKISGFKSFSNETEVVFPRGITAVVGPNGCGKSNIGDALNWVLGEQSARMLRGASMQDVIFNGSESRKPVGMAEVSLHLSGLNGTPDGADREVVLTRRLFRSGESEYLVNGSRARLKDIQEILRESRVGAQTYATIEQGRIEQILNAKPKERRLIIEEAAGVSGFKHKRRLAELKLEATQANLLRVGDVVAEVRRQINSLKRQAAKARRYQRLREDLRRKEGIRFGWRARSLDADLERLRREETAARDDESGAAGRLASLEAWLEGERASIEEAERCAREATDALHELDIEIDREESRVRSCRERIAETRALEERLAGEAAALETRAASEDEAARVQAASLHAEQTGLDEAAARLAELEADLREREQRLSERRDRLETLRRGLFGSMNEAAERRNRKRAVEEALDRNAAQRKRVEAERDQAGTEHARLGEEWGRLSVEAEAAGRQAEALREELSAAEDRLRAARAALETGTEDLTSARERRQSAAARLQTLEDLSTRFAGVSDGVKLLLGSGGNDGVRTCGVVADFLEATRDVESAAEAYLSALLPAVIVEDDGDARRAAEVLRARGSGRTQLLSRTQPAGRPAVGAGAPSGGPAFPESLLSDRRVLGRLSDRLTLTGQNGFVRDRIGEAVLVDSLESALALHREHPHADFLAPTGETVWASGLVSAGGHGAADQGLLAHNRHVQQARARLAEAERSATELQSRAESCRLAAAAGEAEVERIRTASAEAEKRGVETTLRAERSSEERDRTGRRTSILGEELTAIHDEAARLAADLVEAQGLVRESEDAHLDAARELEAEAAGIDAVEKGFREAGEATAALRADLAVRVQRRATLERERDRLREALAEVRDRLTATRAEKESARQRGAEASQTLARTEAELVAHIAERERVAGEIARLDRANAERHDALAEREGEVKATRSDLEAARERVQTSELARVGAEADRRHLDDLCAQELGRTAAEAAESAGAELDAVDPATLEATVGEIRQRIDALGPVNLTAIAEFSELEERYTFLTSQQTDLERSMESLRETIRKINRSTRERFLEAFEAIRASFQEVFKSLFHGGRADLRLEEGEDLLETGVEILVQPPGKRLGNVHLLSGGEKAMAAIALLFAIFRSKPSPFCLLDEVDAALDDINVNRFTKMLRDHASQTQFIMITHNKRSMEAADLLYGVTMEEPGVSKLVSLRL